MPVSDVNGVELYWERAGSGARLLFCNGSGTTLERARPLIDLLAENKEIAKHADRKKLEKLVDPANYLGVAGEMVDRVLKMRK